MEIDDITGIIIETAIEIHKEPGSGLLKSAYEVTMTKMFIERFMRESSNLYGEAKR